MDPKLTLAGLMEAVIRAIHPLLDGRPAHLPAWDALRSIDNERKLLLKDVQGQVKEITDDKGRLLLSAGKKEKA